MKHDLDDLAVLRLHEVGAAVQGVCHDVVLVRRGDHGAARVQREVDHGVGRALRDEDLLLAALLLLDGVVVGVHVRRHDVVLVLVPLLREVGGVEELEADRLDVGHALVDDVGDHGVARARREVVPDQFARHVLCEDVVLVLVVPRLCEVVGGGGVGSRRGW